MLRHKQLCGEEFRHRRTFNCDRSGSNVSFDGVGRASLRCRGTHKKMAKLRITSASFKHYKAFSRFQIALHEFNVLVGPNNAGKSTLVGAFRILAEGLRRARSRKAVPLEVDNLITWGHHLSLSELSVASENIFHNYDDSIPAEIRFRLSNGNHLRLHFPERDTCYLIPESTKKVATTPAAFKTDFDVDVGFVP